MGRLDPGRDGEVAFQPCTTVCGWENEEDGESPSDDSNPWPCRSANGENKASVKDLKGLEVYYEESGDDDCQACGKEGDS